LITTKKGTGKFKVNFSTVASVSTKMGNVDVLNADEFRSFVNANALKVIENARVSKYQLAKSDLSGSMGNR
jgi:hypothetical protein